ncbi:MAG: MarR family transcriptional regulator [Alphaproteobacteria bacterium]|nr:MarR family transcriptional regulator [Alphaproteobacteria bacterium]MCZ6764733.1 MarR family transcriptional regulator [Alphaproteobacteria bacterium]
MTSQTGLEVSQTKPEVGTSTRLADSDAPSFLYYHLYRAQNRIAQDFADAIGPDEITPCQFNALCHIRTHPGMSQTQLSGAIGREKSTVTPIIDRLERRGLVNRRASPSDRRTYALYLSALGETTYQRMVTTANSHDQNMQDRLTAPELETLVDLLQRVCDD